MDKTSTVGLSAYWLVPLALAFFPMLTLGQSLPPHTPGCTTGPPASQSSLAPGNHPVHILCPCVGFLKVKGTFEILMDIINLLSPKVMPMCIATYSFAESLLNNFYGRLPVPGPAPLTDGETKFPKSKDPV